MAPASMRGSLRPNQSGPHSYVFLALLLMVVVLAFNYWNSSSKNSELLEQLSNFQRKHKVCYDEVQAQRKTSKNVEDTLEKTKRELSELIIQINKFKMSEKGYIEQIESSGRNFSLVKRNYEDLINKTNRECERQVEESRSGAEVSCSKEKDDLMKDQEREKEEQKQQLQWQQQKEQQLQETIQQQGEELKKLQAEQQQHQTNQHGVGQRNRQESHKQKQQNKRDWSQEQGQGQKMGNEILKQGEGQQRVTWNRTQGEGQQKDRGSLKQEEGRQSKSWSQKQVEGQQRDSESQKQEEGQKRDSESQKQGEGQKRDSESQKQGEGQPVQKEADLEEKSNLEQDGEETIKPTRWKKDLEDASQKSDNAIAVPARDGSPKEKSLEPTAHFTAADGTLSMSSVSTELEQVKDTKFQNANTTWVLQPPEAKDMKLLKFGTDHAPGLRPAHWVDRARRPDELRQEMQQGSTGIQSAGAFSGKRANEETSIQVNKTGSIEGQRGIATNVEDASKQQKMIGKPGQNKVAGSPGQLGGITNLKDESLEDIEMATEGEEPVKNIQVPGYPSHGVGQDESQDVAQEES